MLKYILISIGILWLLSKALKYLFRFLLIFTGKRVQKEMEKQMRYHQAQQEHHQQGAAGTTIITNKTNKPKTSNEGEYIDFEEVE